MIASGLLVFVLTILIHLSLDVDVFGNPPITKLYNSKEGNSSRSQEAVRGSGQGKYDQHMVRVHCNNLSSWLVGQETYLGSGNGTKGDERRGEG